MQMMPRLVRPVLIKLNRDICTHLRALQSDVMLFTRSAVEAEDMTPQQQEQTNAQDLQTSSYIRPPALCMSFKWPTLLATV